MLLGRRMEQERLREVVGAARQGRSAALIVRGEPGIGKSTLLADAGAAARQAGCLVLTTTGVPAEYGLEQAGLVTLLTPVAERLDELADEHRQVLRGVLAGEPASPLAAGIALLHLLSARAAEQPVVLVVDDAQWLDVTTLTTVRFAVGRLAAEPVALLAADRSDEPCDLSDTEVLQLRGLDADAARELLGTAGEVTRSVAAACHERCGGNPLALLELSRALSPAQRSGRVALPEQLRLDEALVARLTRRIEPLPEGTRQALLVVALGGHLTPGELASALAGLGLTTGDLHPAEEAGVLVDDRGTRRFAHPLLREVAALAPPPALRSVHRVLAGALTGDRRAWHLADAGGDDAPAAVEALVEVAQRAEQRAAMDAAAVALERAARLTDDPAQAFSLLLRAGTDHLADGNLALAFPALHSAHAAATDDVARGDAAWMLGDLLCWHTSVAEGVAMLRESSARLAAAHPDRAAQLLAVAANFIALGGDLRRAVELAHQAERLAADADPLARAAVRVIGSHLRLIHASPDSWGQVDAERWAELDAVDEMTGPGAPGDLLSLSQLVAFDLMAVERWTEALSLLDRVIQAAQTAGQLRIADFGLAMRGEVLWRQGHWLEARAESMAHVDLHLRFDERTGDFGHATVARVEAVLGLGGAAALHAGQAVERGERIGMGVMTAWGWHAQGLVALAEDRPEDALEPLLRIWRLCRQGEIGNPGPLWWQGDLLEALVSGHRPDDARRLCHWLAEAAEVTGSRWARAVVARGAGLLDHDVEQAARSVSLLDELGAPFEAARSRLVLAEALLQSDECPVAADDPERQKVLTEALDAFEVLGAVVWERRARSALGAGAGARSERATLPLAAALSEAELRVALAVGRGLTNRQVAVELAVSPKTVDVHLQSIYRKLGVHSRTALALLVERERTTSS